ncbi:MAG: hypothetical protein UX44_C0004G0009 [candidate division WWE3 bacterium GW2011_GWA1_46_21]|uniref:Uncharacterized protein n=3 Tax=Katanobacteria TaxID=422282 RepID=A0A0G1SEC7_UNCKA|nr:MAG: hypothetical protein UX44_C0004G0009 [candidate division WWE3 bacterium GW2011_GWA1_46_21]KKU50533.1 MAG: hypothetical protein UX73_C0021G0002 [candidate division WWE3 bacterium GW2011_GWC1_47_10]KKU57682.1 MAG: hypothetical protein UX79_C0006G0018 [candidate division WWE3 bacterium GW2011_GWB1_47_11]
MLLTPHTLVGVAIATAVPNPYISVPLSFVLHFVGDTVPHWDFFSNSEKHQRIQGWRPLAVMADLIVGVAVGLTFTLYALWVAGNSNLALNIFLCGVASVLPDALEGPYIYMENEPKLLSYITWLQKRIQFQAPLPWGVISQAIVVLVSAALIANSMILK